MDRHLCSGCGQWCAFHLSVCAFVYVCVYTCFFMFVNVFVWVCGHEVRVRACVSRV